jgi:hypothetical protein
MAQAELMVAMGPNKWAPRLSGVSGSRRRRTTFRRKANAREQSDFSPLRTPAPGGGSGGGGGGGGGSDGKLQPSNVLLLARISLFIFFISRDVTGTTRWECLKLRARKKERVSERGRGSVCECERERERE